MAETGAAGMARAGGRLQPDSLVLGADADSHRVGLTFA